MSDETNKIYFCRMLDLFINVGTECLLLVFYKHKPRNEVANFFSSSDVQSKFLKLKNKGFLQEAQYQLVIDSNPEPDKFDITLLICLLTNIFPNEIKAPRTGWKLDPNQTDTSLSADLLRMRKLRNEIAHQGSAKMTNDEFNKKFTYVEEILIRIASSVGQNVEKEIQSKVIQIKTKKEYGDIVIDALMKIFEKWTSHLETIQANTNETKQDVKEILHTVKNFAETLQQTFVKGNNSGAAIDEVDYKEQPCINPDAMTEKELDYWSNNIGTEWDQLRIYLEFTEDQHEHVRVMYPCMLRSRIYTMLKKWHDVVARNGENPKLLLAAAFVQASNNFEKAYKLVKQGEVDSI